MLNRLSLTCSLCSLTMILAGCSNVPEGPRTVPATGVITLDGVPVEGANIVFIDDAGVNPARALSDEDGHFSLDAFEYKPGAVPGSYKAVVTKTEVREISAADMQSEEAQHAGEDTGGMVVNTLPKKYQTPSALLSFTIGEDGADNLDLVLTSK